MSNHSATALSTDRLQSNQNESRTSGDRVSHKQASQGRIGLASIHSVSDIRHSRKSNFVLCSTLRTARPTSYTGQACSASFLEEFFSETGLTLPAKRRSFGICQCPPRVGKHYQNYDEDSHYHRYCDNSSQCSPWRQEYPRRSRKEVERTNNNGGPVALWFEHP